MSLGRIAVLTVAVSLCSAVFLDTMLDAEGWSRRSRIAEDLASLRTQNDAAAEQAAVLRRQIQALRERPEVQERAIRDELGYVKPGEIVLNLSDSDAN